MSATRAGGRSRRFGAPRLHHRLTGSTNDVCRDLAEAGAPAGTIVTADQQSAGRGRRGRDWTTPAGGALLVSALARELGLRDSLLALAVPVAVCEALTACGVAGARVKWPNDVWLAERKLAGILIEARPPAWAVIGIGINTATEVESADTRWPAAAADVDRELLLAALCDALGDWTSAGPSPVSERFAELDLLRGRRISWDGPESGEGVAAGIDAAGSLVVELGDGSSRALAAGEVSLSSIGRASA